MSRRLLFLAPLAVFAQPDSPRNRLCIAANEFMGGFSSWAVSMNAKRDTLDMRAVESFSPLPNMWRRVERLWREWIKA